ncbi:MAG: EVE domain-containing protein [Planctomycetota bacterium]
MNYWLMKSDPETYSFNDLKRDRRTTWDGVRNPQALQSLRTMKMGDNVLIYHSGEDKAVVGLAEIVSDPYADPNQSDPKWAVVDVKIKRILDKPIPLATIKADKAFTGFGLVRNSRLSVMPVPPTLWEKLLAMSDA